MHCLVLDSPTYYPGSGDSGEKPLKNKPTLGLPELYKQAAQFAPKAIIAAAHPFDEPPKSHQKLLNRGFWHLQDLTDSALDYWQILNGRLDHFWEKGLQVWVKQLLNGQKIGVLGGTDAHGNFNCFRQIRIPFWQMTHSYEQRLGETRTGLILDAPLSKKAIMTALAKNAR